MVAKEKMSFFTGPSGFSLAGIAQQVASKVEKSIDTVLQIDPNAQKPSLFPPDLGTGFPPLFLFFLLLSSLFPFSFFLFPFSFFLSHQALLFQTNLDGEQEVTIQKFQEDISRLFPPKSRSNITKLLNDYAQQLALVRAEV